MVKKKFLIFAGVAIVLLAVIILLFFYTSEKDNFSVRTFLLKSNVPLGGDYEYKIRIENNKDSLEKFNLAINGDEDVFSLEENSFSLSAHEQKELSLFFKDSLMKVAVYSGELVISDGSQKKMIPIVVTVENDKNLLSIIHSTIADYSNVYAGGKLGLDIKVYDLNDLAVPSLSSESFIQNINGEILWSDEQELIVDGSKTEVVSIPKNWPKGQYLFVTKINYKGVESISSYIFTIENKSYNLLQNFNSKLLILIILVFILGFIILLFYLIRIRDEFLVSLKKQQHKELIENINLIETSKKKIVQSKKSPVEKKKRIRNLNKVKKKILHKIKKRQAVQRKELRKLKKGHKKSEIQNRLNSWQNQGYKMFEAKKELGSNTKKQVSKWRKQGYKL